MDRVKRAATLRVSVAVFLYPIGNCVLWTHSKDNGEAIFLSHRKLLVFGNAYLVKRLFTTSKW